MMQCSYQAAVVATNVRCLVFTCSASYTRQEDIRYNLAALIDTAIAIHLVGSSSNQCMYCQAQPSSIKLQLS